MFDLAQKITEWRKQMLAAGIKSPAPLEELESHLRDHIDRLKAGLSEEEAFHSATQQLGNSKILKQEFSKVKRHGFWILRGSPLALKILAVWFLVLGLDSMSLFLREFAGLRGMLNWLSWCLALSGCLYILIGIGLLRRQNGWRIAAVAASFYRMCLMPVYVFQICYVFKKLVASPGAYEFMGLRLPFVFIYIFLVLNSAMSFWAVYLLTRSTVRNLFRPTTAN